MMYYLNNCYIINNMESFQGNVTDDVYEAMEGLHNEEVNEIKKDMQYYKYEKENYELRFDDAKSQLYDSQRIVEELKNYIKDNRNTILEYILELQNTIENGIDA